MASSLLAANFRKAGYACGMNKKEHKLVKLGQVVEETPKTESKSEVLGL